MTTSPYIADVTETTFDSVVIHRSHETPVLVDFWAAWCGPCQSLMPILAKLAEEYQGRFFLAKVNSDEQQALASRFSVRSLPTVKLFKAGTEAAQFMGAQPERSIRALLDQHIKRPSDEALEAALDAEGGGNREGALKMLRQTHTEDPGNDRVTAHLGRLLCEEGQDAESEAVLKRLSLRGQSDTEIAGLLARIQFVRMVATAPPLATLEQTLAAQPRDMQTRLWLGARYLLIGRAEDALEQWLTIVRTDRNFGEDAGRRSLLNAFAFLGAKSELVRRYRSLLAVTIT